MKVFDHQGLLFGGALALFIALTFVVAIGPARENEQNNAPLPGVEPLSSDALAGRNHFVAEGCVACHTQQVRGVAMDQPWGRPSIPADYAGATRIDVWRNTATLMGTARIGPDLANVGNRQPSSDWHLLHLYQPRSVVPASIMPAYPWLFEERDRRGDEFVVPVPPQFRRGTGDVVPTTKALQLVAYLRSLKQVTLPNGFAVRAEGRADNRPTPAGTTNGAALYAMHCQACHQPNGDGLRGAFPALKGSTIVLNDDPTLFVNIIMNGYAGRTREGYGIMPPVGTMNGLKPEAVLAIVNHERTSWGNAARPLSLDEIVAALSAK